MKRLFPFFVFLLFCCTTSLPIYAQLPSESEPINTFVDGYLVTTYNDTIYGLVKVNQKIGYVSSIIFQNYKYKPTKFTVHDIQAFAQKRTFVIEAYPELSCIDRTYAHYESKVLPPSKRNKHSSKAFVERLMQSLDLKLYTYPSNLSTKSNGFLEKNADVKYWIQSPKLKEMFVLEERTFDWAYQALFGECTELENYVLVNKMKHELGNWGSYMQYHSTICNKPTTKP